MVKYDASLHAEIGSQLKEARIRKHMSLQDMSDAIGGIKTKQTIMRYENGTTRMEAETMKKICSVLGLDANSVVRTAKIRQAVNAEFGSGNYGIPANTASKKSPASKGKQIPASKDINIQLAYASADEKTQRAVRILLGLE